MDFIRAETDVWIVSIVLRASKKFLDRDETNENYANGIGNKRTYLTRDIRDRRNAMELDRALIDEINLELLFLALFLLDHSNSAAR